jgi:hypothetical protein
MWLLFLSFSNQNFSFPQHSAAFETQFSLLNTLPNESCLHFFAHLTCFFSCGKVFNFLNVWWHEATLYWLSSLFTVQSYKFIHTHSFITIAEFHSSFFIAASSGRGSPLGCRAEIRTRGCSSTRYQLSHAAL